MYGLRVQFHHFECGHLLFQHSLFKRFWKGLETLVEDHSCYYNDFFLFMNESHPGGEGRVSPHLLRVRNHYSHFYANV